MRFGDDRALETQAAIALVNTAPERAGTELLGDVTALRGYLAEHSFSHQGTPHSNGSDLPAIHRLRERLDAALTADTVADAAEILNAIMTESGTVPRMTNHDGRPWHIDFHAVGTDIPRHLGAELATASAILLIGTGADRVRHCAAPDCNRILADLSRNGSRRYCVEGKCGNRMAVQAYRERRRSEH